jgi:hypothetical protein
VKTLLWIYDALGGGNKGGGEWEDPRIWDDLSSRIEFAMIWLAVCSIKIKSSSCSSRLVCWRNPPGKDKYQLS